MNNELLSGDKEIFPLMYRTRIGLALSQDGYNFARIEADHHTGALMDAGDENEWDQTCNTNPQASHSHAI